jgi:hypothetical protein
VAGFVGLPAAADEPPSGAAFAFLSSIDASPVRRPFDCLTHTSEAFAIDAEIIRPTIAALIALVRIFVTRSSIAPIYPDTF